jgi:hypothetical protein
VSGNQVIRFSGSNVPAEFDNVALIPLALCFVDRRYQRSRKEAFLKKNKWDRRLNESVTVSERANGRYAIIGGQQRVEMAREAGLTHILATIQTGLALPEEAALYHKLASQYSRENALDRYKAGRISGDPIVKEIDDQVRRAGFTVNHSDGEKTIEAAGSLFRLQYMGTEDLIYRVLRVIGSVWEGAQGSTDGVMLVGMGRFLKEITGKDDEVIRKLRSFSVQQIRSWASEWWMLNPRTGKESSYTAALLRAFNWKRKKRIRPEEN